MTAFFALAAVCDAAILVLNLVERELQDEVATGQSMPRSQIHSVLSLLRILNDFVLVVAPIGFVVAVCWVVSRRTRARVALAGEGGVEPKLGTVWPLGFWSAVAAFGISGFVSFRASDIHRTAIAPHDFVVYRTYLAAGAALLLVGYIFWIVLIRRATALQERREALAPMPEEVPHPVPVSIPGVSRAIADEIGLLRVLRRFLLVIAFATAGIMALAGTSEIVSGEGGPGSAVMMGLGATGLWLLIRNVRGRRSRRLPTTGP